VQGRYILDNVITIWEGMQWAQSLGQDALFIKIDFEKAYDRIEWRFILAMLQVIGFGPYFLRSINMLFRYASVILTMNNAQSQSILLARSVQQGCPLAPSLFILATEAFSYLLAFQAS